MKNRHLYPKNWEAISLTTRINAGWRCEFCGKPCRPPEVSLNQTGEWLAENHPEWFERLFKVIEDDEHGVIEIEKPHRFTLTVAHMNHNPSDCDPNNLKALCAPCHLAYDAIHHQNSRRTNRMKTAEAAGQLTLF